MTHHQNMASSEKHAEPAGIPPQLSDLHCYTETEGVITTTMFDVPGYRVVRVLGTVYGLTVRSRNWAAGLGMVVKSIAGGELRWFTSMVSHTNLFFFSPPPLLPFSPRRRFFFLQAFSSVIPPSFHCRGG
jgi:hypothetical protein